MTSLTLPDPAHRGLWILFAALIAHALFVLIAGLNQSFLFYYEFRQTQTALSAYWLTQGGDWLAYETPLFGAPWQLPLEFPLFQWIVAGLHLVTGLPLDPLGRFVSFAFYLATLWPIYVFSRRWEKGHTFFLILSCLFLASPIYLFWGRTFLIESLALFLSALWLAYLSAALTSRRLPHFLIATLAGGLAMLVKVTTFPGFVLAGGVLVLVDVIRSQVFADLRRQINGAHLTRLTLAYGPFLALAILPLVMYLPWVAASDDIKAASELTERYTSTNVQDWIFGGLDLRMSTRLWWDTIFSRSIPATLGWSYILLLPVALYLLWQRVSAWSWMVAGLLFLAPFLIFSNVHAIHPYYQVANAVFLLGLAALILFRVQERLAVKFFAPLMIGVVALQLTHFYMNDYTRMVRDVTPSKNLGRTLRVADYLKSATDPDSGLMIFGYHYSAELPYYSERRALLVEFRVAPEQMRRLTATPEAYFGDTPIGAYVICDPRSWDGRWRADQQAIIDDFGTALAERMNPVSVSGCDIYLPDSGES